MTLGENKKIALALIEEYDPSNPLLTDDTEIQNKINLCYATAYMELGQTKKILKTKTIKDISETEGVGYEEFSLPSSLMQLKRVIAWDENGKDVEADYKHVGKKLYINRASKAQYIIEYYVYPTEIKANTPDDFMLELDLDAQMILPYKVADDILKIDSSADYTAFLNEYNRKINAFDTRREIPSIVVEDGVI